MALSQRQKKWILKNRKRYSIPELADEMNAEEIDIQKFLEENPIPKTPKIFYLFLILIPILFFVLFEVTLNIAGYGNNYEVFVKPAENYPEKLVLNPDYPTKFFGKSVFVPSVIPDFFDKLKKENTFRVFVLGGSSAAGWPFANNAAFSRYIQRRLELEYPNSNIEVVNLGMSAVNSYTILDLLPAVIEHKPDAVLIYAGHNEYYGAMGAGSKLTLGDSPEIVNFLIKLRNYKTIQLMTDILAWAQRSLDPSEENVDRSETLMGRMIGNNAILFDSEIYKTGIKQFDYNLPIILEKLIQARIPVIIGNLASNYRMKPFNTNSPEESEEARAKYMLADSLYREGNYLEAEKYFRLAKDLDGVRFRGPSAFNEIIFKSAERANILFVDIDKALSNEAENGIIGYDLMVDHLHPNVKGYTIIGETFFKAMESAGYLPPSPKSEYNSSQVDSILSANFPYTKLDSVWAELRIKKLTGSYPFVPKGEKNVLISSVKIDDFVDSTAVELFARKISHPSAHSKIADKYYAEKNYDAFIKEMDAAIKDRRFNEFLLFELVQKLVAIGNYNDALPYLSRLHLLNPNDYTNKWLGSIAVENKEYKKALKYLAESLKLNNKDAQVYFNLSGALYMTGKIDAAIKAVEEALKINPNYSQAKAFHEALLNQKK